MKAVFLVLAAERPTYIYIYPPFKFASKATQIIGTDWPSTVAFTGDERRNPFI